MKPDIIIMGASGHAKVCIELLRASGLPVAYCVGLTDSPAYCLDIPVLYGNSQLEKLRQQGYHRIFIGVAINSLREKLSRIALQQGFELVNAIHPQAIISPSARLGTGIAIMPGAVINAEASIDDLTIINTGATIDHECQIGQLVHIAPQSALAGNVKVGNRCFLGIGVRVIPNITIAPNVTVGAGAVVINDIAADTVAVGIPARPVAPSA